MQSVNLKIKIATGQMPDTLSVKSTNRSFVCMDTVFIVLCVSDKATVSNVSLSLHFSYILHITTNLFLKAELCETRQ